MTSLSRIALPAVAVFLSGCTGGGDFSAYFPTVKFDKLQLTALDWEHIDVDFLFNVDNPNPVGMPLERFDYGLDLEEFTILSGSNPDGLRLDPEATTQVALPVSLNFVDIYDAVEATRGLDYLGFGLHGNFGWDTDFGPVDLNYDEHGSFPALRTPKLSMKELRIREANTDRVGFDLDLGVDNDQGSSLFFQNFAYKVKLAGVKVADGNEEELGDAPGAAESTLSLPFEIDYIDAIDAIAAVASGDKIKVDLSASSDVDTPFGPVPISIDENGNLKVGE